MTKAIFTTFGVLILIGVLLFFTGIIGKGCNQAVNATHIDDAVENYEEFQSIYNTCEKINTDLCSKREIPDSDASFVQITKAQQLAAMKANLNRWVQEYNAKSQMWGRSLWKSRKLPYQLSVEDFNCYNK